MAFAKVDYRLYFTGRAVNDLSEIVGHIAQDDDEVASRFGDRSLRSRLSACKLHF